MRFCNFVLICSLFIISDIYGSFSYTNEEWEYILNSIEFSHRIISQSPELIKHREEERIYLEDRRICPELFGAYAFLENGEEVYLPLVFNDESGVFFFRSLHFFAKKPFKFVCNDCRYEWEGGVFTTRCPSCRSKDISNVLNH